MTPFFKAIYRLEARIRGRFSHVPVLYAFIGGSLMILFWRGIWHTADLLELNGGFLGFAFYPVTTLFWTVALMIIIGVFIPLFIGDQIIISGLKQEKKLSEKTQKEIREEEVSIDVVNAKIERLSSQIDEIKKLLEK